MLIFLEGVLQRRTHDVLGVSRHFSGKHNAVCSVP